MSSKLSYILLKIGAVFVVLVVVVVITLKVIALVSIELSIESMLTPKDILEPVFVLALAIRSGSIGIVAS